MEEEKITKVSILENGPIMIEGKFTLYPIDDDHAIEKTFLCRCGCSEKKPFCDGTHKKTHFYGK